MLGAPGSGKGTQGKILAERLGLPKITTGDLLRAAMKDGTPLGLDAKKYYDEGKLVPDSIILGMIKEQLDRPEAKTGAILDGFPRTAAQAELVDRTLAASGQRLNHILLLDVTEDELVRRMSARAQVEGRPDDTPEAIATRLQISQPDTTPLIAHYAQRGIVHRVPATTFPVGDITKETARLLGVTQQALAAGVAQARAGNHVGDIGHAVQQVAEGAGYSVVRELVGHGIGAAFHEEPQVPNYGKPKRGPRLAPGMTIAIEPMINIGGSAIRTLDDKWTVVTQDGSLSAHFEHTVAITANGAPPRILTTADPGASPPG